jgi:hypothetical protein
VLIIGIDPHKGSHTAVAIDGDERLVSELLVRAGSPTTRATVVLGGRLRTPALGDRRRDRHGCLARPAARGRGARRCWTCAGVVGGGAAVGLRPQGQDRSLRCAFGRDRRVTQPASTRGCARGSRCRTLAIASDPYGHFGDAVPAWRACYWDRCRTDRLAVIRGSRVADSVGSPLGRTVRATCV